MKTQTDTYAVIDRLVAQFREEGVPAVIDAHSYTDQHGESQVMVGIRFGDHMSIYADTWAGVLETLVKMAADGIAVEAPATDRPTVSDRRPECTDTVVYRRRGYVVETHEDDTLTVRLPNGAFRNVHLDQVVGIEVPEEAS